MNCHTQSVYWRRGRDGPKQLRSIQKADIRLSHITDNMWGWKDGVCFEKVLKRQGWSTISSPNHFSQQIYSSDNSAVEIFTATGIMTNAAP